MRGSTILAPKDSVLWGTIGSYVLNLAEERYEVVLCDISLEEALSADEAFLTSTTRGVVPIVALDDARVGDGTVGPVVRYLMARYRAAAFGE